MHIVCLFIFKCLSRWGLYLWLSVQYVSFINIYVESIDKNYFSLNTNILITVARFISVLSDINWQDRRDNGQVSLVLNQQEQIEHTIWRIASDCLFFFLDMSKCLVFSIRWRIRFRFYDISPNKYIQYVDKIALGMFSICIMLFHYYCFLIINIYLFLLFCFLIYCLRHKKKKTPPFFFLRASNTQSVEGGVGY